MTKKRWLWRLVVPLSLAALSGACGTGRTEQVAPAPADVERTGAASRDGGSSASHVHHADGLPAVDAPAAMSLHHLDAPWLDQRGDTVRLADLGDRVQVVAMVYTTCGQACPRIVADMKRVEAAVPGVGLVLVSIDPLRDTPAQLARFAADARLDPARWTLLTGSEDGLLELAAVLGVRFRRISDSDFMHTNALTVLGRDGVVRHQQLGFGGVAATIDAVRTADAAGAAGGDLR